MAGASTNDPTGYSLGTLTLVLLTGVLIGVLAMTAFTCHRLASAPAAAASASVSPAMRATPIAAAPDTARSYDSVSSTHTITVTKYVLYAVHDTIPGQCDTVVSSVGFPSSPIPISLKGVIPAIAAPLIAAFRPQEPRNALELYGKVGHDFLPAGGYTAALSFWVNLDQLHVTNATIYGELGYLHGFYLVIGVMGKLWGAW